MYRISKKFEFSASHIINGLPDNHPCARLHGHNYTVEIILSSWELDITGFIIDFGDLSPLKDFINNALDHRHLNDVLPFNPTSENLAKYLFEWCFEQWPQTSEVKVSETSKTWAGYHG